MNGQLARIASDLEDVDAAINTKFKEKRLLATTVSLRCGCWSLIHHVSNGPTAWSTLASQPSEVEA